MSADGNPPPRPAPVPPPLRAKRGCLFYGCLSVVLLSLVLLLGAGLTYYAAKRFTDRMVRNYTDSGPTLLEKVELPRAQMDALQQRLIGFKNALDSGEPGAELILTAEQLNALINEQPDLRGKLFVRIENDRVAGDVSYPLADLGPLKLKGRYLNGTASFKVSLDQGRFDVRLDDMTVKSKPLPSVFMRELRKQNFAADFENDPSVSTNVAKLENIQIGNGQILLRTKGAPKP